MVRVWVARGALVYMVSILLYAAAAGQDTAELGRRLNEMDRNVSVSVGVMQRDIDGLRRDIDMIRSDISEGKKILFGVAGTVVAQVIIYALGFKFERKKGGDA